MPTSIAACISCRMAATDAYEKAREKEFAASSTPKSVDEIVFTKSATEAINTVAYGWGKPNIGEGERDRAHPSWSTKFQHRFPGKI